jgi:HK97 family phage prohead protease
MLNKKHNDLSHCELKLDGLEEGQFSGYGSVNGNVDSYGDIIKKGAFTKSLSRTSNIPMLHSHDPSKVIGVWKSIVEDDVGLKVVGEFTPNHSLASDTYASLKHGAIAGLSIGFMIPKGGSHQKDDNRIIETIDLKEISIVSMPANDKATVSMVKSEEFIRDIESITELKDAEAILRDAGFSRSTAKCFLSRIKKLNNQRDAESLVDDEIRSILKQAATSKDLKRIFG